MKRLLGFIFMLSLLMSMGYSAPAPPVLITGEIVDYNVANIDVIIKNTNSGFTETIQTNHFGEYQYEYLNSLNCNDNIQISILGTISLVHVQHVVVNDVIVVVQHAEEVEEELL